MGFYNSEIDFNFIIIISLIELFGLIHISIVNHLCGTILRMESFMVEFPKLFPFGTCLKRLYCIFNAQQVLSSIYMWKPPQIETQCCE
jgi:hypothetical protein